MTSDATGDGGEELDGSDPIAVSGTVSGERGATRGRARWEVFVPIVISVVVLDQLSKAWLLSSVAPGEAIRVIGDWLRLIQSQNSGALFGMFRDQAILFGLISLGVVGLIIGYHAVSGRNLYLSVALGLLLGGALGNLIDRFRLGYVVDWVDMGIGDIRFWTFNVADAAITISILMLIGLALFPSVAARLGASTDA